MPLFTIGGTQTTVGSLLAVIVVGIVTIVTAHYVRKAVQALFDVAHDDKADSSRAFGMFAALLVYLVGFEIALHLLGLKLTTVFAAGGFLAVAAGFAAKNITENFLSGAILRAERTIRSGDLLIIHDQWITIDHIGARVTVATTFDGEEVLIPNTLIAQSVVVNLTRHDRFYRISTLVGVRYDADLKLVRRTLEETVDKIEWQSSNNSPFVNLDGFGESSVNYKVAVWLDDASDSGSRKSDLHEAIWWALKDKGITIAFPQLDVHVDQVPVDAAGKQDK
jgi:small-conductance mechanosensitive channel